MGIGRSHDYDCRVIRPIFLGHDCSHSHDFDSDAAVINHSVWFHNRAAYRVPVPGYPRRVYKVVFELFSIFIDLNYAR